MDKRERNSNHEMEKREFANIHFLKNVLRQLLFLAIVTVMKIKNKQTNKQIKMKRYAHTTF